MIVWVLSYHFVRRYSKQPLTFTALLDSRLAAYDPVNREEFRRLQEQTKQLAFLKNEPILDWLLQERSAVVQVHPKAPEGKAFLARKV